MTLTTPAGVAQPDPDRRRPRVARGGRTGAGPCGAVLTLTFPAGGLVMIHRFWTGPPAPPWVAAFGATTQAMHPDAGFVDWTPIPCHRPSARRSPGGRRAASNVARYHLLAMFGGIWLDCDVEPLRPLDDVLLGDDLVVASCGGPEGGVMAAPPVTPRSPRSRSRPARRCSPAPS